MNRVHCNIPLGEGNNAELARRPGKSPVKNQRGAPPARLSQNNRGTSLDHAVNHSPEIVQAYARVFGHEMSERYRDQNPSYLKSLRRLLLAPIECTRRVRSIRTYQLQTNSCLQSTLSVICNWLGCPLAWKTDLAKVWPADHILDADVKSLVVARP